MKKIVKLTESDLVKLIKKVVNETNVDKDKVKNTTYKPKMESIEMDEAESEVDRKKKGCCRPSYPCVSDYYMCVNCQCVKRIKV
jgi:hypothetical protein